MNASILIVDDDRSWAGIIAAILKDSGYTVTHVEEANEAYSELKKRPADLIILDLEMPGVSGFQFLDLIKKEKETASIPVIMCSVRGGVEQKIQGLKTGADDYLAKPCSNKELLARVEAVLRRSRHDGRTDSALSAEGIDLDLDRMEASAGGKRIRLTKIESVLLAALIRKRGSVFSYQALADEVRSEDCTSTNVYVHVSNIRKKLGRLGELIETVYGVGYKFAPAKQK